MTTSRIVRGTKGRIFIIIFVILVVTAIIACYNNTRLQLEDIQKSNELCHQQQENLSTQLQVIFDYKQRLEKSLKTEKAERQQAKADFENKLNQQKLTNEKATNDAKLQYTSLQQHYNLLQTEFSDFREESSKIQREHLDEINNLQAKVKEVQGQYKKSENEYRNNLEHLKTQMKQLQLEKERLETQVKNTQVESNKELLQENEKLKKEMEILKADNHFNSNFNVFPQDDKHEEPQKRLESSTLKFSKQVALNSNEYQIRDSRNQPLEQEKEANNVGDNPQNNLDNDINVVDQANQAELPKIEKQDNNSFYVLPEPNVNLLEKIKVKSSTKSSVKMLKVSIDGALPLREPTMTPESVKKKASSSERVQPVMNQNVLPLPFNNNNNGDKKLPEGVVPVPPKKLFEASKQEVQKTLEEDKNDIPDDVNAALPGRYRNNIINTEIEQINKDIKDQKAANEEKDSGAHEVFNIPGLANDENLEDLKNINPNSKNGEDMEKHHINALRAGEKEIAAHGPKIYDADVYKEIANDMIEEDDEDDYPNNMDRHKEPAVRN